MYNERIRLVGVYVSMEISTPAKAVARSACRRRVGLIVVNSRDQYRSFAVQHGFLISEEVIRHNTRLDVLHGDQETIGRGLGYE